MLIPLVGRSIVSGPSSGQDVLIWTKIKGYNWYDDKEVWTDIVKAQCASFTTMDCYLCAQQRIYISDFQYEIWPRNLQNVAECR